MYIEPHSNLYQDSLDLSQAAVLVWIILYSDRVFSRSIALLLVFSLIPNHVTTLKAYPKTFLIFNT